MLQLCLFWINRPISQWFCQIYIFPCFMQLIALNVGFPPKMFSWILSNCGWLKNLWFPRTAQQMEMYFSAKWKKRLFANSCRTSYFRIIQSECTCIKVNTLQKNAFTCRPTPLSAPRYITESYLHKTLWKVKHRRATAGLLVWMQRGKTRLIFC